MKLGEVSVWSIESLNEIKIELVVEELKSGSGKFDLYSKCTYATEGEQAITFYATDDPITSMDEGVPVDYLTNYIQCLNKEFVPPVFDNLTKAYNRLIHAREHGVPLDQATQFEYFKLKLKLVDNTSYEEATLFKLYHNSSKSKFILIRDREYFEDGLLYKCRIEFNRTLLSLMSKLCQTQFKEIWERSERRKL